MIGRDQNLLSVALVNMAPDRMGESFDDLGQNETKTLLVRVRFQQNTLNSP